MTSLLALLLGRWRWAVAVGGLVLAITAGGWVVHRLDASALARAEGRAVVAEAAARAAEARVRLDAAAATAVDTARTTQTAAARRSEDAAHAIARLPHAEDPLDTGVLAEWSSAVDRLRHDAVAARPADAPADASGAARALPPP